MSDIDLRHGDCLELLPTLADNSVDMILADPPYGTTYCKWDSVIPFEPMWAELKRVIKPNGAIVLFADLRFAIGLIQSASIPFRYELVWQKTMPVGVLNANKMPLRAHELMLVFYKKLPTYTPQKTVGHAPYKAICKRRNAVDSSVYGARKCDTRSDSGGERHPTSVQKFSNTKGDTATGVAGNRRIHPTQKPVPLLEFLIQSYSQPSDTVLDFTMGSGSTGAACLNTNRKFIGFELDATYFAKAKERIDNHIPITPLPRHKDDL